MSTFGEVAVAAVKFCKANPKASPVDAWKQMAKLSFPSSPSMQIKGCPKSAFLGLCENCYVVGIPPGRYTRSKKNKVYAIAAVNALFKNPRLVDNEDSWWTEATSGNGISENGQLDVVCALWNKKLLRLSSKS